MAKVNELIYDVREGIKAFSDDIEISNRHILYLYNIKRAKYLRQDLNNYQKTIDNSVKQTFCLKVEEVDAYECSIDFGCEKIMRTTLPLPKPIELHSKVAITKIKPITRVSIPFNFITKERAAFVEEGGFNKAIYAFIDVDNYIYFVGNSTGLKLLECVTVTGVFEDPLALSEYPNCCDCNVEQNSCFDEMTSEYPLQPHYIDLIREEVIKNLLMKYQIPEDKKNDSTD